MSQLHGHSCFQTAVYQADMSEDSCIHYSEGPLMLGLCDLRAALLSRFYLVIVSLRAPLCFHIHCNRSINHLITAMHLLDSE